MGPRAAPRSEFPFLSTPLLCFALLSRDSSTHLDPPPTPGLHHTRERTIYVDADALHTFRNDWVRGELMRRHRESEVAAEMGKPAPRTYPENDPMVNPAYVGWLDLLRFFESKMNLLHKATLSRFQLAVLRTREKKQKMSAKKVSWDD